MSLTRTQIQLAYFLDMDYTAFARQQPFDSGENSLPYGVANGDFNNDGYLDIVATIYGNNNVAVALGYGDGTFNSMMTIADVPSSRINVGRCGRFQQR